MWVKTSDRLPERNTIVLVWIMDKYGYRAILGKLTTTGTGWHTQEHEAHDEMFPIDKILYWQPLPEGPNEVIEHEGELINAG